MKNKWFEEKKGETIEYRFIDPMHTIGLALPNVESAVFYS